MGRLPRVKSQSGFYHVILRGINKQIIFEDDADKESFLKLLQKLKAEERFEVYAYCLMENHVHLLLKEFDNNLSVVMKKIELCYVRYFNEKYGRTGSLYGSRFKSEAVDNDRYFLTLIRYIHRNPIKAGLSDTIDYPWSSYWEYLNEPLLIDAAFVLEMLGGKKPFIDFNDIPDDNTKAEICSNCRFSDQEAVQMIQAICCIDNPEIIKTMEKGLRNDMIKKIRANNIPIRQISRVTGIGKKIIENVK